MDAQSCSVNTVEAHCACPRLDEDLDVPLFYIPFNQFLDRNRAAHSKNSVWMLVF